jgi:UDP-glucuronate 4-epimerase
VTGAVLVTGAAGLLGNAVRVLLEERGTPVIPIDRVERTEEGREITRCDVTDVHRLHAVVAGRDLDAVIHCGAYSGPMVEIENPNAIVQVNIGGTANVLELARIRKARRFVFCSSTSAYGETPEGVLDESAPMTSSSVYGASKVAGEHLVQAYARQHGLDGVSLRISWVFGPRRQTDCVIRTMISDALEGRPTRMAFGRDFHRQYVHVDDAAAALVAALDSPAIPQPAYNITGGTYLTLQEVGDAVRSVLPEADISLETGPDPVDSVQSRFDISAAARDLGFTPQHDLESGIRSYATWLQDRRSSNGHTA